MYRIAICDDELHCRTEIAKMTEDILRIEGIPCNISEFESGPELLAAISSGREFHVLLLDVIMEELDGMELAAALRRQEDKTSVIFISCNLEMALRGYEVGALRYLSKPLARERLQEALLFCYQTIQEKREILLPTEKGQRRISLSDLVYAEAQGRNVELQLVNERESVSMKISELETMLSEKQFVRCHRAYLVNLAYIQYIRCYEIELKNGDSLPVSRQRFLFTKQRLVDYLEA